MEGFGHDPRRHRGTCPVRVVRAVWTGQAPVREAVVAWACGVVTYEAVDRDRVHRGQVIPCQERVPRVLQVRVVDQSVKEGAASRGCASCQHPSAGPFDLHRDHLCSECRERRDPLRERFPLSSPVGRGACRRGVPSGASRSAISYRLHQMPPSRDGVFCCPATAEPVLLPDEFPHRLSAFSFPQAPSNERDDDKTSYHEDREGAKIRFQSLKVIVKTLPFGGHLASDLVDCPFRHGFVMSRSCAPPLRSPWPASVARPCEQSERQGIQGQQRRGR